MVLLWASWINLTTTAQSLQLLLLLLLLMLLPRLLHSDCHCENPKLQITMQNKRIKMLVWIRTYIRMQCCYTVECVWNTGNVITVAIDWYDIKKLRIVCYVACTIALSCSMCVRVCWTHITCDGWFSNCLIKIQRNVLYVV